MSTKHSAEEHVIMNDKITAKEVRCIGNDGKQYGIIALDVAQEIADESGLDLVLIAPDANPPVCKVMDYSKYRYQQEKKKKEAKKKQKVITVKEIKLSVKIASNDVAYKVKHAREFLEEGNHVKFRVFLKGREQSTPELGVDVLNKVWPMVEDIANRDKEPSQEGRFINMLVIPKKH